MGPRPRYGRHLYDEHRRREGSAEAGMERTSIQPARWLRLEAGACPTVCCGLTASRAAGCARDGTGTGRAGLGSFSPSLPCSASSWNHAAQLRRRTRRYNYRCRKSEMYSTSESWREALAAQGSFHQAGDPLGGN
jgi:hypothetical protein